MNNRMRAKLIIDLAVKYANKYPVHELDFTISGGSYSNLSDYEKGKLLTTYVNEVNRIGYLMQELIKFNSALWQQADHLVNHYTFSHSRLNEAVEDIVEVALQYEQGIKLEGKLKLTMPFECYSGDAKKEMIQQWADAYSLLALQIMGFVGYHRYPEIIKYIDRLEFSDNS